MTHTQWSTPQSSAPQRDYNRIMGHQSVVPNQFGQMKPSNHFAAPSNHLSASLKPDWSKPIEHTPLPKNPYTDFTHQVYGWTDDNMGGGSDGDMSGGDMGCGDMDGGDSSGGTTPIPAEEMVTKSEFDALALQVTQLLSVVSELAPRVPVYDFFWINDAAIESIFPLANAIPSGSSPWCIEAGQTVEVQLSVTATASSGSVIARLFIDGSVVATAQSAR